MAIDSAVMEQLLSDLLKAQNAQSRAQSQAFAKLATASGLDPKVVANAQQKLKTLGDEAEQTAKSTSKMQKAGSMVGSVLADMVGGLMNTAGNLVNFGTAAMAGTAKVSDFIGAFKDLPLVGGLASLLGGFIKLQEEALETFSSLASSGIDLGGSLTGLRTQALSLNLSLKEYEKILKDNSNTLVLMGASASGGARNFNAVAKAMKDGGLHTQLLNLGFTAEEANSTIFQFARSTGGLSKQQQGDYAGVAKSAFQYATSLDLLARLTGESREALQKKMDEEAQEANWQAWLSTQSEETRKKLDQQLKEATLTLGKGGADIVKASAMGIAVQSEQGTAVMSLMNGAASALEEGTRRAKDNTVSSADFFADTNRRLGRLQVETAKEYRQNIDLFNALQQGGDALGATFGPAARTMQVLNNALGENNITVEANAERIRKEMAAAEERRRKADEEAAALRAQQEAIKALGAELWKAFSPLFPIITKFLQEITPKMTQFGNGIAHAIKWLLDRMFTEEGRTEILNKIIDFTSKLIAGTWLALTAGPDAELASKDPERWNKMTPTEKLESGLARAIEWITSAGGNWDNALYRLQRRNRMQAEEEALRGRSLGSWGATGSLFENFGNGTDMTLHGQQTVMNPDQLNRLMSASVADNLKGLIDRLNSTQAEMLHVMKEVADNSRRNVDATQSLSGNAFA